ncbi:MAG: hypothetical protein WBQ34_06605 [Candidatus Acidiferrales bacterium]
MLEVGEQVTPVFDADGDADQQSLSRTVLSSSANGPEPIPHNEREHRVEVTRTPLLND